MVESNKLLLYRFRNRGTASAAEDLVDPAIEPRLNQIFVPLMSVVADPEMRDELRTVAREHNRELVADRGMDVEAQVLEVIRELQDRPRPSISEITARFVKRFGSEYERPITNKWIGFLIRRRLNVRTHKSHGTFVIPIEETPKLERLFERYGLLDERPDPAPDRPARASEGVAPGDVGKDEATRDAPDAQNQIPDVR